MQYAQRSCAFNWGGAWWRVEPPLADGLYDKLNEVWVEDQDNVKELLSPLAVSKEDALTDAIDLDTLESYAGKTGADLKVTNIGLQGVSWSVLEG